MMNITPALHVKNEEYWIYYVLRDLLRVFDRVVMIDTGSTDRTLEIAQATVQRVGHGVLELAQMDLGNNARAIGNCPNLLREMVKTEWMLLVDGDEVWREEPLRALLTLTPPVGTIVGMCNGRNVVNDAGNWAEREGFSADRLFERVVRWNVRTDYPFQSHGLEEKAKAGQIFHTNFECSYFWHVRHLARSPKDGEAYARAKKFHYFPQAGEHRPIPQDWFGEVATDFPNPYLHA